jgi:hypothetical protein
LHVFKGENKVDFLKDFWVIRLEIAAGGTLLAIAYISTYLMEGDPANEILTCGTFGLYMLNCVAYLKIMDRIDAKWKIKGN